MILFKKMAEISGIRRIFLCIALLGFFLCPLYAQQKQKSKVEILNADILKIDRIRYLRKLQGNVRIKQEDISLSCDSALIYDNSNLVEAYSNVSLNQGDTLFLYGDYIRYDGDTKKAEVVDHVRLIDGETQLTTDRLDFDLANDIGYYLNGGVITDKKNRIESREGYYHSKTKNYFYKGNVRIKTPDYEIRSDTLKYDTETNMVYFLGPTEIISDSAYIYCERGWYNMKKDVSRFSVHAFLRTKEHIIRGDTLFYDKNKKYGTGTGHIEMIDTLQQVILCGNQAVYYEEPERSMITDSALFIQFNEGDSLFLHADTLRSFTDSAGYRVLMAYYKVKIYSKDLQGICDSLSYSFSDSVIRMYREPVIWSGGNQLTSRFMKLFSKGQKMDRFEMYDDAMIISKNDSVRYNQIKGKNMFGYFRDNKLYRIDVKGNGQSIYYPEDQGDVIGFDKSECSNIVITVENNKIKKIVMLTAPSGTLDPPPASFTKAERLKGFIRLDNQRPYSREDVFKRK